MESDEFNEWSGFAYLMANLIEKYIGELDIDNLPDPRSISDDDEVKENSTSQF